MEFYEQVKEMIFDGEFEGGERMNETEVGKEFGVRG